MFEPIWNRQIHRSRTDHGERKEGVGTRRLLRSGRRLPRHGAEPHAAATLPGRDGAADRPDARRRCATSRSRCCTPFRRVHGRSVRSQDTSCGHSTGRAAWTASSSPGYRQETERAARVGMTETYAGAAPRSIDNWRWAGVPFYLRTGQAAAGARVGDRRSKFNRPPLQLFRQAGVGRGLEPNLLARAHPAERGHLAAVPGQGPGRAEVRLGTVTMAFNYADYFARTPERPGTRRCSRTA